MAELETIGSCCTPTAHASCCEPEDKAECCGQQSAGSCRCAEDVGRTGELEQVRDGSRAVRRRGSDRPRLA